MIYLKNNIEFVKNEILAKRETMKSVSLDLINEAISFHVKQNLRYNEKTGTTFKKNEWCSKYVNTDEIPVYNNENECAFWEFGGEICNSVSRKQRGFSF